jgi:folate-binding protein YgfZ
MNVSPLHSSHERSGATLTDQSGWMTPTHYGDVAAEYRAVRSAAGLADLSSRGKLRMTGRDRQSFLHRIVSNDINRLKPGEGVYACLLTPQGKIISDMTVYLRDDDLLLDLEPGMTGTVQTILDRYALVDDVVLTDVTGQYGLLGVYGPTSPDAMNAVLDVSEYPDDQRHMRCFWNDIALTIAGSSRSGEPGFEIYIPADQTIKLWQALFDYGLPPVGHEALEILRVESGRPRFGAELDERIIPNEAVKERAVSFDKGCYIGQEPVVMMEHRGRPNRLLAGLRIMGDALPSCNAVLKKDDQEAGWVTSAVRGQSVEGILALGFVRRKFLNPGDRLQMDTGSGLMEAEIVELPFYRKP